LDWFVVAAKRRNSLLQREWSFTIITGNRIFSNGDSLMRTVLVVAGAIVLCAAVAQASNINTQLVATKDATDPTLWHVAIQVQAQGTSAAQGGGVAGMQFDVISKGTNISTPVPNGTSGANLNRVKTVYSIQAADFGVLRIPDKLNATPANNQLGAAFAPYYVDDGDLDALGGSFADSNQSQSNTTLGMNGFQTIATEDWTVPIGQSEGLSLLVVAPLYYDFSATATNGLVAYTTINNGATTAPIVINFPEPASFVLMGLGSLALAACRVHRHLGDERGHSTPVRHGICASHLVSLGYCQADRRALWPSSVARFASGIFKG
jgi:hypothetical protein